MSTSVADVIERARVEILDDVAQPYLWSDAELLRHVVEAQEQAAQRARLFVDSSTVATCQIALVGGTAVYAMDARVIRINRARVSTEQLPLGLIMARDIDRCVPGWEDETGTVPTHAIVDWQSGSVRMYPKPTAAGTVNMTVVRFPLTEPNDPDDLLELNDRHCRHLHHWVAYRAYLKRDSETNRPDLAAEQLALFEREFGRVQPAYDELWAQQHYAEDAFNGRY